MDGPFFVLWIISFLIVACTDLFVFSVWIGPMYKKYLKDSERKNFRGWSIVSKWLIISFIITYDLFFTKHQVDLAPFVYGFALYAFHNISNHAVFYHYNLTLAAADTLCGSLTVGFAAVATKFLSKMFGCQ